VALSKDKEQWFIESCGKQFAADEIVKIARQLAIPIIEQPAFANSLVDCPEGTIFSEEFKEVIEILVANA
jgi:flagellar biosynthesis protein FlhB